MKVVVTGAAGRIGSNLLLGLNAAGVDDIIAVDDLTDGHKYVNLKDARFADYFDRSEFYERFRRGDFPRIDAVLHQGACSDTMEHDGRLMMAQNYRCTKDLVDACQRQGTRLGHGTTSGIFNVGSGRSQPFNDVAEGVVNACRALAGEAELPLAELVRLGLIEYVSFPPALIGKYQCFTQADLGALRGVGCDVPFIDLGQGVRRYVRWLAAAG